MDRPHPTMLAHYRLAEQIGAGGMGVVYRGTNTHLHRDVAIKILSPTALADDKARRRFRREAQALSRVTHPNVAGIYDFDTSDGVDFLVMEYIPGVTLQDRLQQGAFSEPTIVTLAIQVANALVAAHEHGVVHCDLKPANVLLDQDIMRVPAELVLRTKVIATYVGGKEVFRAVPTN